MNTKQVAINRGLVFDGLLFKTFNARGRYIGTDTAKRPQWLKDHPKDFVRLADIRAVFAAATPTRIWPRG